MTLNNEAKLIQRWVKQLRPGPGRKYTPALRQRILAFVEQAKGAGVSVRECSEAIGVPLDTITGWQASRSQPSAQEPIAPFETPLELAVVPEVVAKALVPVEVTPSTLQIGGGLVLVTPRGFRVEGLSLEQAFALVREFE
jgi:transposase-like protein